MKSFSLIVNEINHRKHSMAYKNFWQTLHLDLPLVMGLIILATVGLFVLYSASSEDMLVITRQATRLSIAFGLMFLMAQIPPLKYKLWAPWVYIFGIVLLIAVLVIGHTGNGATRWLNLGFMRFQPSELMKLGMPMMVAWYLNSKTLPPSPSTFIWASVLIIVPTLLTAKQPDLGTALMILFAGACVILLSGISWQIIGGLSCAIAGCGPLLWHFMHSYQKQRVLTFLNPERDPLGSGYHIIQSKIAIGSGGLFGKGWLHGTQSHLHFLPEHSTDFIFALVGEEFGLVGGVLLLFLYAYIVYQGMVIASRGQDTFSRLLAGSLSLSFGLCVFVNMGMVTGILPVVGIPLPLVSYGGTSMVTLLAGFGILMSIQTHRKLVST